MEATGKGCDKDSLVKNTRRKRETLLGGFGLLIRTQTRPELPFKVKLIRKLKRIDIASNGFYFRAPQMQQN